MLLIYVVWAIRAATQNALGDLQDPRFWGLLPVIYPRFMLPMHSLVLTSPMLDCSLTECFFVSWQPTLLPGLEKSEFSGQACAFNWLGWGSVSLLSPWQKEREIILASGFHPCVSSSIALGLWMCRMLGAKGRGRGSWWLHGSPEGEERGRVGRRRGRWEGERVWI